MKAANKIGLWLLEYNLEEDIGILRCSHKTKEKIISSLTLIKQINGENLIVSPVKTAGSIKAIKKITSNLTFK